MGRYLTSSIVIALLYACFGFYVADISSETILLASVIVIVAGILPDIDGSDEVPSREMAGLLAAVSPIVLLEFVPEIARGGTVRVALAVVVCYVLVRLFISRGLRKFFRPRGMIHSIPAAVIVFQITYLLFVDLWLYERIYVAVAAFVGFFSHLLLEAYLSIDLVDKNKKSPRVLKFLGASWFGNAAVYSVMLLLAWVIATDIYPNLGVQAEITY